MWRMADKNKEGNQSLGIKIITNLVRNLSLEARILTWRQKLINNSIKRAGDRFENWIRQ